MARIAGVDLPRQKRVNIGLTYIYGIGHSRAARILGQGNVDPMKKVQDLSEDEVNRIRQVIESEGMVLAIEPMVNFGKPGTRLLNDKWTAVTEDGSYSAHFEHCVAVTKNGPLILTQ